MIIAIHGIVASSAGTDADADAFILAAGITDATQKTAINTLVVDLKGFGIWTKTKALYPFVGGTATTHKFNLKNPLDTDAAYRLSFAGGWIHSANGAAPNGSNAYANTFLNSLANLQLDSMHFSYYSRSTVGDSSHIEIGSLDGSPAKYCHMHAYYDGNVMYALMNSSFATPTAGSGISTGLFLGTRQSSVLTANFINGVKKGNTSLLSDVQTSLNIFIGAGNINGSANLFSTKECAFASIGDGLTDAESTNFYTAVQSFQTSLSRNL